MSADDELPGRYASPPCLAAELAPDYFDPLGVAPQQARDVARWRRAERERLLEERDAMGVEARRSASQAIAAHLATLLSNRLGEVGGHILSAYWPIRREPNIRQLMTDLDAAGVGIALPVVETKARPLVFRRWTPATRMVRGVWDIPVPCEEAGAAVPDIVLTPLVGWDGAGYRLGYGGGYFDRTLAAMAPRPFAVGVGFHAARLRTIYPQPHDIAFDVILTEEGVEFAREVR